MSFAAAEQAAFEFELAQFGETVTFRRTVGGAVQDSPFQALVAELTAEEINDDDRQAFQRIAVIDFKIGDAVLTVPGKIVIGSDEWVVFRPNGRDHGPTAVCESWRIGRGTPIRIGPASK